MFSHSSSFFQVSGSTSIVTGQLFSLSHPHTCCKRHSNSIIAKSLSLSWTCHCTQTHGRRPLCYHYSPCASIWQLLRNACIIKPQSWIRTKQSYKSKSSTGTGCSCIWSVPANTSESCHATSLVNLNEIQSLDDVSWQPNSHNLASPPTRHQLSQYFHIK